MAEDYNTYSQELLLEYTPDGDFVMTFGDEKDYICPDGSVIRFQRIGHTIRVYRLTKPLPGEERKFVDSTAQCQFIIKSNKK